jgi:plastocyanin
MKKILLYLIVALMISSASYARIIVIQTGFNGLRVFNPASVTDAHVGDTVQWVWVSGLQHTTVSTTIPAGAPAWNDTLVNGSPPFNYKITVPGTYNYQCVIHILSGMTGSFVASPAGIQQIGSVVKSFELKQNYPNPFNPSTAINFSIPRNSFVSLKIYDIKGSLVSNLLNENMNAGEYKYDYNAVNLASGIYLYRIQVTDPSGMASNYTVTKQMVLIK